MATHTLQGKNVLVAAGGKNLGGLVSRQAAERYAQVSALSDGRQERVSARRQARAQRRSAAVATA